MVLLAGVASHTIAPTAEDQAFAQRVAERIREIDGPRVRRVILIGSRARGTARPDSDLDLVVLVEIPKSAAPWTQIDARAEAGRITDGLGALPMRVDLTVRTTDRYKEACNVVGGLEWAAAHEGLVVFHAPFSRPPIVRISPQNVRREHVSTWVHHALAALEAFDRTDHGWTPQRLGLAVFERLCTALLVRHGNLPDFQHGLPAMLSQLVPLEPIMAATLQALLVTSAQPRQSALTAAHAVHSHLLRDPQQARVLVKTASRLRALRTRG